MNIAEIVPRDNYMLYIKTEEGKAGLFDLKPYLESEAFAPLKDRNDFERRRHCECFHPGTVYVLGEH
ncbi:MAG: DUF2442 domain-containing protein [Syntrophaceae bacterium]|nr:DUF2442 domain-containing protein [Syntrophaceae bacterium]